jgi:hypothetical protein
MVGLILQLRLARSSEPVYQKTARIALVHQRAPFFKFLLVPVTRLARCVREQ